MGSYSESNDFKNAAWDINEVTQWAWIAAHSDYNMIPTDTSHLLTKEQIYTSNNGGVQLGIRMAELARAVEDMEDITSQQALTQGMRGKSTQPVHSCGTHSATSSNFEYARVQHQPQN